MLTYKTLDECNFSSPGVSTRRPEDLYHKPAETSKFYSMADRQKEPILFNPVPEYEDYNGKVSGRDTEPFGGVGSF